MEIRGLLRVYSLHWAEATLHWSADLMGTATLSPVVNHLIRVSHTFYARGARTSLLIISVMSIRWFDFVLSDQVFSPPQRPQVKAANLERRLASTKVCFLT